MLHAPCLAVSSRSHTSQKACLFLCIARSTLICFFGFRMCLTGNRSVTRLLKHIHIHTHTHTHTHTLRVLYIGKFPLLGELGIISHVFTDIHNIHGSRRFLDFMTSSSSRRWTFFNCRKFCPSQRPPSSISLDPGRKLSNFWSSYGKCPVWCYPPICPWVFLVIFW